MMDDGSSVAVFLVTNERQLFPRQPLSFDIAYISGNSINCSEDGGPIQVQRGNYEISLQGDFEAESSFVIRFRTKSRSASEEHRLLNTFVRESGFVQCTSVIMADSTRRIDVVCLTNINNKVLMKKGTRLIVKMI